MFFSLKSNYVETVKIWLIRFFVKPVVCLSDVEKKYLSRGIQKMV